MNNTYTPPNSTLVKVLSWIHASDTRFIVVIGLAVNAFFATMYLGLPLLLK